MDSLSCKCDILPHKGDDLCIGSQLKCKFHPKESIVEANAEKLESYWFFLNYVLAFQRCRLVIAIVTYIVTVLRKFYMQSYLVCAYK